MDFFINFSKLSALVVNYKARPPMGTTAAAMTSTIDTIRPFGVSVTVLPHLIAEYNYVMDCLATTSIKPSPSVLLGIHHKSSSMILLTVLEFGSIIVVMAGGYLGNSVELKISSLAIAGFWWIIYLYVNLHILWNSSHNYWIFTIHFNAILQYTGFTNDFIEISREEFTAFAVENNELQALAADRQVLSIKLLLYSDNWMRSNNYQSQILAFHRFIFYSIIVGFGAAFYNAPSNTAWFYMAVVWIGVYVAIRLFFAFCCRSRSY